jgi:hypothetical protein
MCDYFYSPLHTQTVYNIIVALVGDKFQISFWGRSSVNETLYEAVYDIARE